jgi:L-threonylcarbamoyladenylate synthase
MTPRTLRLSTQTPSALAQAAEMLLQGQLIVIPTDTVYAIGAHAFRPEAVAQIFAVKERPANVPIPLLLADPAVMEIVCLDIPALAWEIADRFWPGGLSLVLRRAATVPDVVTAGGPTVAVRVPNHSAVREICRRLGAPLAATSANRHGQPAAVTAEEAEAELGGKVPLLLDGGICPGGMASTVLDLTVSPPAVLRPGPVSAEALYAVLSNHQ